MWNSEQTCNISQCKLINNIRKQVYIFQCKFIVNKKTGLHFSIQVCLHFNWCAPAGKIENMHWQCRSPKGTLHCININSIFMRTLCSLYLYFLNRLWSNTMLLQILSYLHLIYTVACSTTKCHVTFRKQPKSGIEGKHKFNCRVLIVTKK